MVATLGSIRIDFLHCPSNVHVFVCVCMLKMKWKPRCKYKYDKYVMCLTYRFRIWLNFEMCAATKYTIWHTPTHTHTQTKYLYGFIMDFLPIFFHFSFVSFGSWLLVLMPLLKSCILRTHFNFCSKCANFLKSVINWPSMVSEKLYSLTFQTLLISNFCSSFDLKHIEKLFIFPFFSVCILQIVETYNDKKYENSSGIHSGGSDLDSSCHIDQTNQNFILSSRCSSSELRSDYSAFNERLRSPPSMKVRTHIYIYNIHGHAWSKHSPNYFVFSFI